MAIYHYTCTPGDSTICCSFLLARAFLTYVDEVDWTVDKRKDIKEKKKKHILFSYIAPSMMYSVLLQRDTANLHHSVGMLRCKCYIMYTINRSYKMTTQFLKCFTSSDIMCSVPKRSDPWQPPLCSTHSSILAHKSSSPPWGPSLPCPTLRRHGSDRENK